MSAFIFGGGPAGIAAAMQPGVRAWNPSGGKYGFLGGWLAGYSLMHTLGAVGLYQELLERQKWDAIKDYRFWRRTDEACIDEWLWKRSRILFHALLTDEGGTAA